MHLLDKLFRSQIFFNPKASFSYFAANVAWNVNIWTIFLLNKSQNLLFAFYFKIPNKKKTRQYADKKKKIRTIVVTKKVFLIFQFYTRT